MNIMNVSKSVENKTTVILKIELLQEELKPYLDKAMARISKQVKVPGFRPGHVPADMLKKQVSEMEMYQEALNDIVEGTLPMAVKQENLDFVGRPDVKVETLAPGNPVVYTATFSLMPEVELKKYKDVKVKKAEVKVDEAKFTKTMDDLRKLRVSYDLVDRPAAMKDQAVIDFDIKLDGVSIEGGQGKDVPVIIGENYFVPGFEEAVVGMKAGETKQVKLTFPTDYSAKHLAGKLTDATITVHKVNKVVLPAMDEEFAKTLNFKSLAELEEQIRQNLQKELTAKADQEFENKVLEAVINQASFDPIPAPMMEYELDRMMEELKQQVEDQGGKLNDYLEHVKKTPEELRTGWKDHAEKRIKGALVIKAVAEAENITISEEAITTEVEKRKAAYKESPDVQKQLDGLEFRGYTRTVLRNQQAIEKMKEYAGK